MYEPADKHGGATVVVHFFWIAMARANLVRKLPAHAAIRAFPQDPHRSRVITESKRLLPG